MVKVMQLNNVEICHKGARMITCDTVGLGKTEILSQYNEAIPAWYERSCIPPDSF